MDTEHEICSRFHDFPVQYQHSFTVQAILCNAQLVNMLAGIKTGKKIVISTNCLYCFAEL